MILLELHSGFFEEHPGPIEAPVHDGWRLITPCDEDVRKGASFETLVANCPLLREAGALQGNHFDDFHLLMHEVCKKALLPQPWHQLMSKKQFHNVDGVTVNRISGRSETIPVMQFQRHNTMVRVHWFSVAGKRLMLVSRVFVKRPSNGSLDAEKRRAGTVLERYLEACDSNVARLIEAQGGTNGFRKLV